MSRAPPNDVSFHNLCLLKRITYQGRHWSGAKKATQFWSTDDEAIPANGSTVINVATVASVRPNEKHIYFSISITVQIRKWRPRIKDDLPKDMITYSHIHSSASKIFTDDS